MHIGSPIPKKHARIEIIPLIDIMFFLLASFMMVSLSQVHVKGIRLNLPTGLMGQTQSRREYVALSVDTNGDIWYDKEKVDPNEVYQRMVHVHQVAPGAKIFIRGDKNAYHGDILRLIEQVRAAGFYKIAFEVKSPSLPTSEAR